MKSKRDEDLRNSVIDKDVQSMLRPLNLMQVLVLNPKYRIKDNLITPNNVLNKFVLVLGAVIFLTAYMYRVIDIMLDENIKRYHAIDFLYFASCFDFSFYGGGLIMNFIIHFIQTKKHVKFILIFQEVHRFIHNETNCRLYVMRNWINFGILFGFYIITFLYVYFIHLKTPWHVTFNLMILVTLDSNIIYATRLIDLLTDKVVAWKRQVLRFHRNGCNEMHCKQMFQTYSQILSCYKIYKNVFQASVSRAYFLY